MEDETKGCTEEKEQHPKTIGEIRKKRLEIESEIMEEAKQELIIVFEKKDTAMVTAIAVLLKSF